MDIIVSNPPYIDINDEEVGEVVRKYEPSLALFAKENGLACYRGILENSKKVLNSNGKIYFEIGYKQKEDIFNLVKELKLNADIEAFKDIYGNDRIIKISFKD